MRRVVGFILRVALLEGVWLLLVGTRQSTEVLAGLAAAAAGALLADRLMARGLLALSVDPPLLARAWRLPAMVLFDFAIVTWALARAVGRGERVRGRWTTVPFPTATGARGRWQRAFAIATSNGAANSIVVDIADGEAELHVLDARVYTARTVL